MRVLVTGGAGFIGSHVVDAYLEAGHDVTVLDNFSTGRRENLNSGAELSERDVTDPGLADWLADSDFDVVNHHAAQIDVRRSMAEPIFDAEVNVLGSINVFRAAAEAGVRRVVYISTGGAVYGEPEYLPVDEAHPVRPFCGYGISKYAAEHYLEMYRRSHGLDYVVLRYPNVYGPRQNPEGEAGVVSIFADRMARGEACTIYGDGEQQRDFLFVGDCARANLMVSDLDNSPTSRTYNLATGKPTTINGLHGLLAEITDHDLPPTYAPAKPGETYRIYLSADKAERELGWQPTVTLRDGLAETVASFRAESNVL